LYKNSRAALLLVIQNVRTSSTFHYFIAHMFTTIKLPSTYLPIENFYLNYQTEPLNRFRCLVKTCFPFYWLKWHLFRIILMLKLKCTCLYSVKHFYFKYTN